MKSQIKKAADQISNRIKEKEEKSIGNDAHILELDRSIQVDSYSCGVQSTYAILKYYGKAKSVNRIEKLLKTTDEGTDEQNIYSLFRERGLIVYRRLNANFSFIKKAINYYQAPILTTIDEESHYIVVYGYSKYEIFVLDPVLLRPFVKWSKKKFYKRWDYWGAIIHQ